MRKIVAASASALAFMALAACSDVDETQTQSIDQPPAADQMQTDDPLVEPSDDQMDETPNQ